MPIPPRRFILHSPIRNLDTFRAFAEQAVQLQAHGDVAINISTLADKGWYELPPGGSPWHEYASLNPTLSKFFPHPTLAPHLPADFVANNRELLLAKAAILREFGLKAGFWSYDPNFLPESFFQANPHLRGARVDHPRRSRQEAFAPCVDQPEMLDMYAWMMGELVRHLPELTTYSFKTNDAGAGFCWSENLYSGPNGPQHCRNRTVGERVKGFVEALHRGARQHGVDIDVHLSGYITENEQDRILLHLPAHSYVEGRTDTVISLGSLINLTFPVVGVCDPLGLLASMERLRDARITTIFLGFRAMYDRGYDTLETSGLIIELLDQSLREPVTGLMPRLQRLHRLCGEWGGVSQADTLLEAFVTLHDALRIKAAAAAQMGTYSGGVTQRWITRPLVIKPDVLTPEEEGYFLSYIFNIHEREARHDYIDLAGSRMIPESLLPTRDDPRIPAMRSVVSQLLRVAAACEGATGAPRAQWLAHMAISLRLWANMLCTANNFYGAQIVRDRCAEALAGEPRIPSKIPTLTGDPNLLAFNEIRRDELDNAIELLALLEQGGVDFVVRADTSREADPFLLEPELVEHVRRKIMIMRNHWLDGEHYLTSPFK